MFQHLGIWASLSHLFCVNYGICWCFAVIALSHSFAMTQGSVHHCTMVHSEWGWKWFYHVLIWVSIEFFFINSVLSVSPSSAPAAGCGLGSAIGFGSLWPGFALEHELIAEGWLSHRLNNGEGKLWTLCPAVAHSPVTIFFTVSYGHKPYLGLYCTCWRLRMDWYRFGYDHLCWKPLCFHLSGCNHVTYLHNTYKYLPLM